MATIAALTETFEGGTDGQDVTTTNSNATGIYGTPPTFSTDHAIAGDVSMHINPAATFSYVHLQGADQTEIRFDIYVYFAELLPTNSAFANWLNGTTKVGDLRIQNDTFQLRDNNNGRWNSTHTVQAGQWYRLSIRCAPGSATGHQARLFYGDNLFGTTPDEDSGGVSATVAGQTVVNSIRIGSMASATADYYMDYLATNDTDWPAPAQEPEPTGDVWFYDTGTAWVDVTTQVHYDTGTAWVTV